MEFSTRKMFNGARGFLPFAGLFAVVVALTVLTSCKTSALGLTPTAGESALLAPGMTAEATVRGVELSWEAAAGAVGYELSTWWARETGWQQIGGDNLTGTEYTHKEAAAWTTYYYSIRAVNAAGEKSGWLTEYPFATGLAAAEAEFSTLSPTVAASALYAPKLMARATEWGVELSWAAVAGAVRYELMTWWDEETGWQSIGSYNLTGKTYMHTDVRTWWTYHYSIRSVNAAGETSNWWLKYPSATARPVFTATATDKALPAVARRGANIEL